MVVVVVVVVVVVMVYTYHISTTTTTGGDGECVGIVSRRMLLLANLTTPFLLLRRPPLCPGPLSLSSQQVQLLHMLPTLLATPLSIGLGRCGTSYS